MEDTPSLAAFTPNSPHSWSGSTFLRGKLGSAKPYFALVYSACCATAPRGVQSIPGGQRLSKPKLNLHGPVVLFWMHPCSPGQQKLQWLLCCWTVCVALRPRTWESPTGGHITAWPLTAMCPWARYLNSLHLTQVLPGWKTTGFLPTCKKNKGNQGETRSHISLNLLSYSIVQCFSNYKLDPLGDYEINLEDHDSPS